MALGRTCKPKGNSLPCFILKKFQEVPLLEHAVLFRFGLSQISQQFRLGNQAHAPTQNKIFSDKDFDEPTISSTRRVKKLYTRHMQIMNRATIHHLHKKSLHRFPHIWVGSFIQSLKHFFIIYLFILFLKFWMAQTN